MLCLTRLAGGLGPRPRALTYCWWCTGDLNCDTLQLRSRPLTFQPVAGCGPRARGGGEAYRQSPGFLVASELRATLPSSTRLLPPPDCPEGRLRGQSPCPSADKEGRSASGADGVQAEGSRRGQDGEPPSPPCRCRQHPSRLRVLPCARLTVHCKPPAWAWADPATYNLASVSTLARAVMIWKDQDGYWAGGRLRPRPRRALAVPGWLFQPQDPRGPSPAVAGSRGWSGSASGKPIPAGQPARGAWREGRTAQARPCRPAGRVCPWGGLGLLL